LIERGVGEYDPSFVITKLGVKVNRCLVCGGLERMERRDGDSGPFYRGQIRDPSGTHYFDVAPFQPELHPDAEELLARFETGDAILVSIVGRQKSNESEDGGIFTSIRAESFTEIDQETYKSWMVEAADATLRRLDAYAASQGADLTEDGFRSAGVPDDLVSGLIKSREHYSEFDTEAYKVWILKAFSRALGRTEESVEVSINSESEPTEEKSVQATEGAEARDVILEILTSSGENLVEYDVLVGACISAGSSREDAEDAIESLKDVSMEITEPRFGFFSIST
jgi:RPA family protein